MEKKITVSRKKAKILTVSRKKAKILTVNRKSSYPIETLIISQCNGIFTDQSIFRYFFREIFQFQST